MTLDYSGPVPPLGRLAADPNARRLSTDVFGRSYSGVALDVAEPAVAAMSIRTILHYIPSVSEKFRYSPDDTLTECLGVLGVAGRVGSNRWLGHLLAVPPEPHAPFARPWLWRDALDA